MNFQQGPPGYFSPGSLAGSLIWGLIFLAVAGAAAFAVRHWSRRPSARASQLHLDPPAIRFIGQMLQLTSFLVDMILYAHLSPALRNLGTALLTSASVISILLGLAAQNTLENVVAGLALLLYHPFRLGDEIQLSTPAGVETGVVQAFTFGYRIPLKADHRQFVVPNSVMVNSTIIRSANPGAACINPGHLDGLFAFELPAFQQTTPY